MLNKSFRLRSLSITWRVLVFVALTVTICLSLLASLLNSSINHHFLQQDAGELEVMTRAIEHQLQGDFINHEELAKDLEQAVSGHHGVYYQVRTVDGSNIYSNSQYDFTTSAVSAQMAGKFEIENIQLWQVDNKTFRGLVTGVEVSGVDYKVTTAIDMGFHLNFLKDFKYSLWTIMIGSCLLTLLAAWLAIHQGLSPLRGLSHEVEDIQTNKMNVRLDSTQVPSELINLVHSFNQMLDRMEEGFTRLANFSTDLAHELRSPLTNIITQTQVSLSRPRESEKYQEVLFSNLEELEQLKKMVNDMLGIAKASNGLIKPEKQVLSVAKEVQALFDFFEAYADEADITLKAVESKLMIYCDQLHLRQSLSNLLSNAIRHTPKGSTVTIDSYVTSSNTVNISVINPGESIPEESIPYLFDRFYRVDKSRKRHYKGAGLGLGLAIAKTMVEANDGHLSVTSDQNLTRFTVNLPLASPKTLKKGI